MAEDKGGVIRGRVAKAEGFTYTLDGKTCIACHKPTEVSTELPDRRYCTNRSCNAVMVGEPPWERE